ncbi:MAG: ADP-dependent glucokinase/phosphofructokinase [Alphaproteobacteria bacterium]|nr:ADP-dependent glucokinase/phosphofructokinase [Alphaproteobacteria bacterium]
MNNTDLVNLWTKKFDIVSKQIKKISKIPSVATAFNSNIDAIIKIKGEVLAKLIIDNNISLEDIEDVKISCFEKETDVILGIVKCFCRGIAEEWITEDIKIYNWMEKNLGYDKLQMGGQAGIIANALALLGVQKVIAHTNSHPELQAKQFLNLNNLYAFNDKNILEKAFDISKNSDTPLIHWIIEFDIDDSFSVYGKTFKCPKSNRFIATYDPLNMNLVMNEGFVKYLDKNSVDYLILSGFHPLLEKCNGVKLIDNAVKTIKKWKKNNPEMITHLEIASTQDKVIRKAIIEKISPLADSIGLNERETIDLLEILGQDTLSQTIEKETNSCNLFKAILFLKNKLKCKRIQLHMFGLYLTIQDKDFVFTPEQNLKGMMTASVVSSSKAFLGELTTKDDTTKTLGTDVSERGICELTNLSNLINNPQLLQKGYCEYDNFYVSAIPTILIKKPKTLVGMGDTISSVSLLAGR